MPLATSAGSNCSPFRGAELYLSLSPATYGATITKQWGLSSDVPLVGDFDGDGRAEIAVYRPSGGLWYVADPILNTIVINGQQWGLSSDVPNPHDYDGDNRADVAVYRPSTGVWYILSSSNGALISMQWGLSSDSPIEKNDDPGGWR